MELIEATYRTNRFLVFFDILARFFDTIARNPEMGANQLQAGQVNCGVCEADEM